VKPMAFFFGHLYLSLAPILISRMYSSFVDLVNGANLVGATLMDHLPPLNKSLLSINKFWQLVILEGTLCSPTQKNGRLVLA